MSIPATSPEARPQRLALAIVVAGRDTGDQELPGALLLDEPTRGMDRTRKAELADLGRDLSERGTAVMIATHDVEFAATFADRVILLARGEVAADSSAAELLSGGWYFSSEVARISMAARSRWKQGVAALRGGPARRPSGRRGDLAGGGGHGARGDAAGGFAWYERSRPPSPDRRSGRGARGDLGRRTRGLLTDPERSSRAPTSS